MKKIINCVAVVLILCLVLSVCFNTEFLTQDNSLKIAAKTIKIKVKFNANGGTVSKKSKKVTYGKKYGKLPVPSKKKYSFKGWWTKKSGGKKITKNGKVKYKKNKPLFARWKVKSVALSYGKKVLSLCNKERAKKGLPKLKWDDTLYKAANKRAKEIVKVFSHTRPDGSSCFTVLDEYNISYTSAGENLATGQNTPKEVVKAWMKSKGHRANILSDMTTLSVGVVKGGKYGGYSWAQLFTR
jgi:uncharacterized protein YkwD